MMPILEELSKGRHFEQDFIIPCVRWYLSYKLSYRDLGSGPINLLSRRDMV